MSQNKNVFDDWFNQHIQFHEKEKERKHKLFTSNIQPYLTIDGKPIYHRQPSKKSYLFFLFGMLLILVVVIILLFNLSPDLMNCVFDYWKTFFSNLIH